MQLVSGDAGKGRDGVGAGRVLTLGDHARHETSWSIKRFDSDVYETRARRLFKRASEFLMLAASYRALGNLVEAAEKEALGFLLIAEGEAWAFDGSLIPGNLLLNEGINEAWNLICAAGGTTAYNNANAQLGVGDSTTAAAATQTDLQAATNKLYKGMEAGFPTSGSTQKATWKSSFGSSEANFAWQEFSLRNGATADKNLNRKVQAEGTKTSGQTWTLTLDITLS